MMKFSLEIFDVLFHLRMFLPIALLEVFFWPNENVYIKKNLSVFMPNLNIRHLSKIKIKMSKQPY